MRSSVLPTALVTSLLTLAACGSSPGCRAVTGGALGAGSGAAIGWMAGNPLAGAVVGGVAGAATGLLTPASTFSAGPSPVCN